MIPNDEVDTALLQHAVQTVSAARCTTGCISEPRVARHEGRLPVHGAPASRTAAQYAQYVSQQMSSFRSGRTWSSVRKSGDKPPCTHSTLPSTKACNRPLHVSHCSSAVPWQNNAVGYGQSVQTDAASERRPELAFSPRGSGSQKLLCNTARHLHCRISFGTRRRTRTPADHQPISALPPWHSMEDKCAFLCSRHAAFALIRETSPLGLTR